MGLIFALFGAGDMGLGLAADPGIAEGVTGMSLDEMRTQQPELTNLIDFQVRAGGAWLLSMAILLMGVASQGFRRGERWAWWTMWGSFPLATVLLLAIGSTVTLAGDVIPPPMLSAPVFLAVAVIAQLMAWPKPLRAPAA